jgi:hypothetical protein
MATQSGKTGRPNIFTGAKSPEAQRRQFIEAPMEAAGQSALGSVEELAILLSVLPEAFAASQRRELERVKRSGIENDPRVAALEISIEQADVLQTMVRRGQARGQHALAGFTSKDNVFHGFVSDSNFAPLKGLTVRLTGSKTTRVKTLSATTDDDGYFSIVLSAKSDTQQDSGTKTSPINISQRIADLFASLSREPIPPSEAGAEADVSQVEILSKGKLLYTDPVFVALDEGSVYREYVIADSNLFAIPTPPPSAKKRSQKGRKSVKPRSKK